MQFQLMQFQPLLFQSVAFSTYSIFDLTEVSTETNLDKMIDSLLNYICLL